MKLSDIMNRFPQTVTAEDTLERARLLVWGGFRHLPVVERPSQKLVGLLTERDLAEHRAKTGQSLASRPKDTVAIAMQSKPQTAGADDSLTEAAARMAAEKISCLPITETGRLVGLITTTDVLAAEVRSSMQPEQHGGPPVGEIMTRDPQAVHPGDRLLDAAARMQKGGIRHLPVVDGTMRVVGMLSDRDVRAAVGDPARALQEESVAFIDALRVEDAMSSPAVTTTSDQSCAATARAFADLSASAVPVVDADNKLLGIVSYVDILRAFGE